MGTRLDAITSRCTRATRRFWPKALKSSSALPLSFSALSPWRRPGDAPAEETRCGGGVMRTVLRILERAGRLPARRSTFKIENPP